MGSHDLMVADSDGGQIALAVREAIEAALLDNRALIVEHLEINVNVAISSQGEATVGTGQGDIAAGEATMTTEFAQ